MNRLFVDMDGTMARFYEADRCLERMYEPGFFRSLNKYESVVKAIQAVSHSHHVKIYILSSVPEANYIRVTEEKTDWLKWAGVKLPWSDCELTTDYILFPVIGKSKVDAVRELTGQPVGPDDFLLDDHNANLREWRGAGGVSIKLVNEINDKGTNGPLWDGARIRYDWSAKRITDELDRIIRFRNISY